MQNSSSRSWIKKHLGVGIDFGLNLKVPLHICEVVKKANGRSFKLVTQDIFLNMYKLLIRPLLEYFSCVWSSSTIAEIRLLEGV